jgi:Protein of unknown function (DUF3489)
MRASCGVGVVPATRRCVLWENLVNATNTVTSEPQRQPGVPSPSAAKTVARAAQSKAAAESRSRRGKASAKAAPGKRVIKRRQTDGSKQDRVIALLRRREGATLAALVKATGWKPHSVRGFLAGTVRKKLKLRLVSEKADGVRTYRIGTGKTAKKAKTAGARSA